MIEISLTAALGLYGLLIMSGALAIWIYTEVANIQTQKVLGKQNLWRCVYCSFSWLDDALEPISTCPRCGSLNHASDPAAKPAGPVAIMESPGEDDSAEKPRRNPSRRKRPGARSRGPRRRG